MISLKIILSYDLWHLDLKTIWVRYKTTSQIQQKLNMLTYCIFIETVHYFFNSQALLTMFLSPQIARDLNRSLRCH